MYGSCNTIHFKVSVHFAPWLYRSKSFRSNQKLDSSAIKVTSLHTKVTSLHTEVTTLHTEVTSLQNII